MSSSKHTFDVLKRKAFGKKVKTLRNQGITPANIYGNVTDSVAVQINTKDFNKLYHEAGDTGVVYLKLDDEKKERPVLIDEVSFNPITEAVDHVSFKQVDLSEKISAEVPVELIGESDVADAVVVKVVDSVEVEALPTDLPEKFEVDISTLTEIGQSITYQDLTFDSSKVELLVEEEALTTPLVLLQEQAEEEVVEETPAEAELLGDDRLQVQQDDAVESADQESSSEDKQDSSEDKKE